MAIIRRDEQLMSAPDNKVVTPHPRLKTVSGPPRIPEEPALTPLERHQLEVRLDVARERLLMWRIGVILAAMFAIMLTRQLFITL
jgi:hypothetical protein